MPLTRQDRQLVQAVDRLKIYLLLTGGAILIYLLLMPPGDIQMPTSVLGVTLCGMFWLTQKLLSLIDALDLELTRLADSVKRSLTKERK